MKILLFMFGLFISANSFAWNIEVTVNNKSKVVLTVFDVKNVNMTTSISTQTINAGTTAVFTLTEASSGVSRDYMGISSGTSRNEVKFIDCDERWFDFASSYNPNGWTFIVGRGGPDGKDAYNGRWGSSIKFNTGITSEVRRGTNATGWGGDKKWTITITAMP